MNRNPNAPAIDLIRALPNFADDIAAYDAAIETPCCTGRIDILARIVHRVQAGEAPGVCGSFSEGPGGHGWPFLCAADSDAARDILPPPPHDQWWQ